MDLGCQMGVSMLWMWNPVRYYSSNVCNRVLSHIKWVVMVCFRPVGVYFTHIVCDWIARWKNTFHLINNIPSISWTMTHHIGLVVNSIITEKYRWHPLLSDEINWKQPVDVLLTHRSLTDWLNRIVVIRPTHRKMDNY